jgi:putative FmdB family regulatory protein
MPIYEYRCPSCGADFEKMQKISDGAPPCPACGHADVVKKVSASAFVLKGGGWYKDHYGLKKSAPPTEGAAASAPPEPKPAPAPASTTE